MASGSEADDDIQDNDGAYQEETDEDGNDEKKKKKGKAGSNSKVRKAGLKDTKDEDDKSETSATRGKKPVPLEAAVPTSSEFRVLELKERQFACMCCTDPSLLQDTTYNGSLQIILDNYDIARSQFEEAVLKQNDAFFSKLLIKNVDQPPTASGSEVANGSEWTLLGSGVPGNPQALHEAFGPMHRQSMPGL